MQNVPKGICPHLHITVMFFALSALLLSFFPFLPRWMDTNAHAIKPQCLDLSQKIWCFKFSITASMLLQQPLVLQLINHRWCSIQWQPSKLSPASAASPCLFLETGTGPTGDAQPCTVLFLNWDDVSPFLIISRNICDIHLSLWPLGGKADEITTLCNPDGCGRWRALAALPPQPGPTCTVARIGRVYSHNHIYSFSRKLEGLHLHDALGFPGGVRVKIYGQNPTMQKQKSKTKLWWSSQNKLQRSSQSKLWWFSLHEDVSHIKWHQEFLVQHLVSWKVLHFVAPPPLHLHICCMRLPLPLPSSPHFPRHHAPSCCGLTPIKLHYMLEGISNVLMWHHYAKTISLFLLMVQMRLSDCQGFIPRGHLRMWLQPRGNVHWWCMYKLFFLRGGG